MFKTLFHVFQDEILPSVGLQRRNSAPEISEPLQYMDDERCMEL